MRTRSTSRCSEAGTARHWHFGTVTRIRGTTVDVNIDGGPPYEDLPRSALYAPSLGDYVAVEHEKTSGADMWLVAHPIAT